MSYDYPTYRHLVFTEEGQDVLLNVMEVAKKLIDAAGAVMAIKLMTGPAIAMADTWTLLAAMDRLIELEYMHEVTGEVAGRRRVFTAGRKWKQ